MSRYKLNERKHLIQKLKTQKRQLTARIKNCTPCPVLELETHIKKLTDERVRFVDRIIDLEDVIRTYQKPGFIRKVWRKIF